MLVGDGERAVGRAVLDDETSKGSPRSRSPVDDLLHRRREDLGLVERRHHDGDPRGAHDCSVAQRRGTGTVVRPAVTRGRPRSLRRPRRRRRAPRARRRRSASSSYVRSASRQRRSIAFCVLADGRGGVDAGRAVGELDHRRVDGEARSEHDLLIGTGAAPRIEDDERVLHRGLGVRAPAASPGRRVDRPAGPAGSGAARPARPRPRSGRRPPRARPRRRADRRARSAGTNASGRARAARSSAASARDGVGPVGSVELRARARRPAARRSSVSGSATGLSAHARASTPSARRAVAADVGDRARPRRLLRRSRRDRRGSPSRSRARPATRAPASSGCTARRRRRRRGRRRGRGTAPRCSEFVISASFTG